MLVKQESLEFQAVEEALVPPEPQARKESLAQLVLLVNQVLQVQLAQLVHKVPEDSRVKQAHRDQKATLVWLELQVPEDPRANKELKVSQESLVPQVQ